jgi:CheY-like chemotaxis protein
LTHPCRGTFPAAIRLNGMERVLLVEDHDEVHRLLCELIAEAGHQADCVKTQHEALALLAPGSHRLVIADVLLPDGTGHTVAERAKELGIKAILMSGHPDEVHSLFISHVLHLAKPFSLDEFHRLIAEHIGGPGPA